MTLCNTLKVVNKPPSLNNGFQQSEIGYFKLISVGSPLLHPQKPVNLIFNLSPSFNIRIQFQQSSINSNKFLHELHSTTFNNLVIGGKGKREGKNLLLKQLLKQKESWNYIIKKEKKQQIPNLANQKNSKSPILEVN